MFLRNIFQASAVLLAATASAQNACNNSPSLCKRAYNNVTYLGAHDSPFLYNKQTNFNDAGNHYYNTTQQLASGVRLLTGQVHKTTVNGQDAWHLCHTSCDLLDAGSLSDWLGEIKTWMDANTNDVVTVLIVNSDNASADTLGAQFNASGISKYAYTPPSASTIPKTWPTLDALIGNNTRLMSFVASLSSPSTTYPYLMDEFTFIFENDYNNNSPSNFSCNPNRPTNLATPQAASQSGRMFLMNHFLYQANSIFQQPNQTYAPTTNGETGLGSLGDSIRTCAGVYSKNPNFVLCDWTNVGPAIASVDTANGVSNAQGRLNLSTAEVQPSSSSGAVGGQKGSLMAVVVAVGVAVALGA